ncbi:unnamed protein product [Rotaria magnacalcarata]|uniref:Uncharacterized protein n=1 Tax=Rotaria magnacalcarata TaxID=392030 RepID=A0A820KE15_9BILA|nr:unnamed protein product [Rotaria magnacalcarata]
MVNSVPPNSSSIVPANNQNVEIFSLIWLDQDVESQYIQNAENKLRSNINLIKKFLDVKKCQQYVEDLSPADRVVMIVSGDLGQQIVPSIHKLRQVISIYVYCMNKERNKRWSKYLTKVKGVINEVDELVSQINTDRQIQRNLDEPFSTIFSIDNLEPVLFEITADPHVTTNKPFADISIFSEFNGESEVVFMLGSIFRLDSVRRSSDHKLWVIQMTLCSEDAHVFPTIPVNARWAQHGVTVAGELQNDYMTYQLCLPYSFCIDDDSQTMIIADYGNDRIVQLKMNSRNGEILAGGGGVGTQLDQLNQPTDVIIDKKTNSLIICDRQNRRCLRWSLSKGTVQGEILFDNIRCWGLAIDDQNNVYISDTEKHAVIRYTMNDKNGTIVAGGQDTSGTVYVVDSWNHRVTLWPKEAKQGTVIAGGNGQGNTSNQLNSPVGLSFDEHGNLYVADCGNDRIQCFSFE